jgi:hypothetical protein
MKFFGVLIVSISFTLNAFGQRDTSLTKKTNMVNWRDVKILEHDSDFNNIIINEAKGEGEISRRKNVHSIKDLNKGELKRLKKEAASNGATINYICFHTTDSSHIYYLYILPAKKMVLKNHQ